MPVPTLEILRIEPEFLAGLAPPPSRIDGPKPTLDEQRELVVARGLRDAATTLAAVARMTDGDVGATVRLALDAAILARSLASSETGLADRAGGWDDSRKQSAVAPM